MYQLYNHMTGRTGAMLYFRYVDAFNAARAVGPGWGVREVTV